MFTTYFFKKDNLYHPITDFLNKSNGNLTRLFTNELT